MNKLIKFPPLKNLKPLVFDIKIDVQGGKPICPGCQEEASERAKEILECLSSYTPKKHPTKMTENDKTPVERVSEKKHSTGVKQVQLDSTY